MNGSNRNTDGSVGVGGVEPAFTADATFADNLQKVHVDLIELHLQGKQAHWNVVGKNFRDTHLILDEVIDAAREFSDTIAERMRAVFITPDGRSSTVAARTSLPSYPEGEVDTAETVDLITARLYATSRMIRTVHDEVDGEDPSTADILHTIIDSLEKYAWMIGAENRVADKSAPRPIHE